MTTRKTLLTAILMFVLFCNTHKVLAQDNEVQIAMAYIDDDETDNSDDRPQYEDENFESSEWNSSNASTETDNNYPQQECCPTPVVLNNTVYYTVVNNSFNVQQSGSNNTMIASYNEQSSQTVDPQNTDKNSFDDFIKKHINPVGVVSTLLLLLVAIIFKILKEEGII